MVEPGASLSQLSFRFRRLELLQRLFHDTCAPSTHLPCIIIMARADTLLMGLVVYLFSFRPRLHTVYPRHHRFRIHCTVVLLVPL